MAKYSWRAVSVLLSCIATLRPVASAIFPDTDVVIVTNNDLNPSNPNRAGALYLKSGFTCPEAVLACAVLQESLLPAPNSTAGLTAANLSVALTSERHGAALDTTQQIWLAGEGASPRSFYLCLIPVCSTNTRNYTEEGLCSVFTPSYQYGGEYTPSAPGSVDLSTSLPVLCTNSAPLTRSNITADTSRQIQLSTPSAGVLTGYRDKFSWRFLGIKYAEPPTGEARFLPPTPVQVSSDTVRSALEYGPACAQVRGFAFRKWIWC